MGLRILIFLPIAASKSRKKTQHNGRVDSLGVCDSTGSIILIKRMVAYPTNGGYVNVTYQNKPGLNRVNPHDAVLLVGVIIIGISIPARSVQNQSGSALRIVMWQSAPDQKKPRHCVRGNAYLLSRIKAPAQGPFMRVTLQGVAASAEG